MSYHVIHHETRFSHCPATFMERLITAVLPSLTLEYCPLPNTRLQIFTTPSSGQYPFHWRIRTLS
ncbi:hypothetical protein FOXYSP1_04522 [Fusarium oxysporum f. sp. phaseoli]